ncbi:MAG: hypothetical protein V1738_06460 [Patescibacteria group bacterium]
MSQLNSRKLFIAATTALFLLSIVLLVQNLALASDGTHGLGSTAAVSGLGGMSADLPTILGGIVRGLLGIVGTIFLVLMIYAGFQWMTAAGNDEAVKKSKGLIMAAVIGLAIIFAAYAITVFVVDIVAPPAGPAAEDATIQGEDPLETLIEVPLSEEEEALIDGAINDECVGENCDLINEALGL